MKLICKVKTTRTLYFDYDDDCIIDYSPKQTYPFYKCGKHYGFLRKGSVLSVYKHREYMANDDLRENEVIAVSKDGAYIIFDDVEDLKSNKWVNVYE